MTFMPRLPQNKEEEDLVMKAILLAAEMRLKEANDSVNEEQDELLYESKYNHWVQKCVGCKRLTKVYSDDYPWCVACETEHGDAYDYLTRGDNSDRY